jgi:ADP-heptose:LPS heptosyltransferase
MRQVTYINSIRKDMTHHPLKDCHDIAVFRALKLGDLLCSIPFFRALRAAFPYAEITLISLPWAKTICERFPHYIDAFIPFPGYPGLPEVSHPDEQSIKNFIATVRERNFDLVIQTHGSGTIVNPLMNEFHARKVAGFHEPGCSGFDASLFMPYPAEEHEVWRQLRLIEHLGLKHQGDFMEFPLYDEDTKELSSFLDYQSLRSRPYVCFHPGASCAQRRWDVRNFAEVGDRLYQRGFNVALTGVPAEQELNAAVISQMRCSGYDFARYGLSLGATARLVADAAFIITNDTGLGHLAAALKTPTIVIFLNPAVIPYWRPLNPSKLVLVNGQSEKCLNYTIDAALKMAAHDAKRSHG